MKISRNARPRKDGWCKMTLCKWKYQENPDQGRTDAARWLYAVKISRNPRPRKDWCCQMTLYKWRYLEIPDQGRTDAARWLYTSENIKKTQTKEGLMLLDDFIQVKISRNPRPRKDWCYQMTLYKWKYLEMPDQGRTDAARWLYTSENI